MDRKSADACWDEALDWLLRITANPEDRGLQERLDAWLRADARHAAALAEARSLWNVTGHLPVDDECRPPAPPALEKKSSASASMRGYRLALAMAAVLLLVVFGPRLYLWTSSDAVTATAEIRSVALHDGSRITLSPRSAIAISDQKSDGRGVRLLHGQAYFEIAHDPKRPFVVQTDAVRVRVLGTGFDVRRTADDVIVAVRHGRVQVELEDSPSSRADLTTGSQVRIHLSDGSVTQGAVPADSVGVWQQGRIESSDWTLAELAETLSPYHVGIVHISDAALAQAPVAGVYRTDQPDVALEAAARVHGGRVHRVTPWILWIDRAD